MKKNIIVAYWPSFTKNPYQDLLGGGSVKRSMNRHPHTIDEAIPLIDTHPLEAYCELYHCPLKPYKIPAIPIIGHYLSKRTSAFRDDSKREGEKLTAEEWSIKFLLKSTFHESDRGYYTFTK